MSDIITEYVYRAGYADGWAEALDAVRQTLSDERVRAQEQGAKREKETQKVLDTFEEMLWRKAFERRERQTPPRIEAA